MCSGTVEASAKTPSGGRFDRYGATPSTILYFPVETPAEVNWDYRSLTTSKTSFSADEDIALCLELTRKEDSDDEITLLYVIRNANGEPVSDASAQLTWDQMWLSAAIPARSRIRARQGSTRWRSM